MSNLNVNNLTPLDGTSGKVGVSGSLAITGSITIPNDTAIFGKNTAGSAKEIAKISNGNRTIFGNNDQGTTVMSSGANLIMDSRGDIQLDASTGDNLIRFVTSSAAGTKDSIIFNTHTGAISASGNISSSVGFIGPGKLLTNVTASNISLGLNLSPASVTNIDLASSNELDLNAGAGANKFTVKAITADNIADGAFAEFKVAYSNGISSDSVIHGSFNGLTGGYITGSILSVAVQEGSASIQIHNETGAQIDADTPFTASFVIL